jgi:hypothetical protein
MQNSDISFDIHQFINSIYKLLESEINFAFPDNNLDINRGHQIFSRMYTLSRFLKTFFNPSFFQIDELETVFIQKILGNILSIQSHIDFSYPKPKEVFDSNRCLSSFAAINAIVQNYERSDKLLNNYCFKKNEEKKLISFDLFQMIDSFDCKSEYFYTFPYHNGVRNYNIEKSHLSCQILLIFGQIFNLFLKNIYASDDALQSMIDDMRKQMNESSQNILSAYNQPDGLYQKDLGFQVIEQFYKNWKKIQSENIPELKNYLDSIHFEFQSKNDINSDSIDKQIKEHKNEFVKKIRSVL